MNDSVIATRARAIRKKKSAENAPKKNKFGVKACTHAGIRFGSTIELARYLQLQSMELDGKIDQLKPHPRFALTINNVSIGWYTGDFSYNVLDEWGSRMRFVVEDVKAPISMTQAYKLRLKILAATTGIVVKEIPSNKIKEWNDRLPD